MNEETIIEKRPTINGQNEKKNEGGAWKHVTLGGVSGILMGAGLLYAGQTIAATKPEELTPEDGANATEQQTADATEHALPVAQMHNDLTFGEAFAAARAEVGPGGVFIWHGGIYNTYTAEEWNAMTPEQKNDFAHQVNPEVPAHHVAAPTDAHPDVAVHTASDDVQVVDQQEAANTASQDSDVHIVGYGDVEGHVAVALDTTGDGQADVAIIDVDDSGGISAPDVVVDRYGNMATVGEVAEAAAAETNDQLAAMENPDVAPDMPDYMNDAMLDA